MGFDGLQVLLDEVVVATLVFLFADQLGVFGLFDPSVACYVDVYRYNCVVHVDTQGGIVGGNSVRCRG